MTKKMVERIHTSQQLFNFRARISSSVDWICPYSGHLNASILRANNYRMTCAPGRNECGRRFIPGIVLYAMPRGLSAIPPDWVIPVPAAHRHDPRWLLEAMPMGDVSIVQWRKGMPTHVLIDPERTDFDVRSMVRMVETMAQTLTIDDIIGAGVGAGVGVGSVTTTVDTVSTHQLPQLTDWQRLGLAFDIIKRGYGL